MLKISRLADYSMVLMHGLSQPDSNLYSATQLADQSSIPLPTVSKVLKLLSDAGLVTATRGVQGGYRLARTPSTTSVADVIAAIDGDLALTECSETLDQCALSGSCQLRSNWQYISKQVQQMLSQISIADMQQPIELESKV